MSIGIEPDVSLATDAPAPGGDEFVAQLARMANALFQGGAPTAPAPLSLPSHVAPVAGGATPQLLSVPPTIGPSATAPGLGGVSTAQNGPP